MNKIVKIKDCKLELFYQASTSKLRENSKYILLIGSEVVLWASNLGYKIENICYLDTNDIVKLKNIEPKHEYAVTKQIIKKITKSNRIISPIALIRKKDMDIYEMLKTQENIVILDNVVDHGNIGAIIRTIRCFNVKHIILTNYKNDYTDIYYKNIISASRGEALSIEYCYEKNTSHLFKLLKKNKYNCVATSVSPEYYVNDFPIIKEPFALFFGNESEGLSKFVEENCNISIGIRMENNIDSHNVAVSTGIILFSLFNGLTNE